MSSRPRPTRSYRPPAPSTRPTARVPYTSYSAGVPRTSYGVAADTYAHTSYGPYANMPHTSYGPYANMPHTSYGPYANMPHTSYGVAANASYQPRSFRQPASRAYGHHTSYNPAEYEYQPRMARTSADTWNEAIMEAGGKVIDYMPWPGRSESLNQTMRDVSVQAAKAAVLVGAGCTAMHAGRRAALPYMGTDEPHAFDWTRS
jgi:hypothetical protein